MKSKHTMQWAMVFIMPSLLIFIVFTLYPFVWTCIQSFFATNTRGDLIRFNELGNYLILLKSTLYKISFKNTIMYIILTVPGTVLLALVMALLTNADIKGMNIFRTIFTFTMGISCAAASMFWNFMYHPTMGLINAIIAKLGGEKIGWLTDTHVAIISISLVTIWLNSGYCYLILVGGLKSIDKVYMECSAIAGLGFWKKLKKVILPLLSPFLFYVLVISIVNAFQSFGVIDMMTHGGPANSTSLLVYAIYKDVFVNFNYSSAASQGVVLFIIVTLISLFQMKIVERQVTYQ